jgi:hypothetical protein
VPRDGLHGGKNPRIPDIPALDLGSDHTLPGPLVGRAVTGPCWCREEESQGQKG